MVTFILVPSKKIAKQVNVLFCILMDATTKEPIKMESVREKEFLFILMVENMKETGRITWFKGMEFIHGLMVPNMTETGRMTKDKGKEFKHGLILKLISTKDRGLEI